MDYDKDELAHRISRSRAYIKREQKERRRRLVAKRAVQRRAVIRRREELENLHEWPVG